MANSFGTAGNPTLIAARIRSVTADNGDRAAVVAGDRTVSYAGLGAMVGAAAQRLTARRLGDPARVAIVSPRTPESIAEFLACLTLGILYLPLDPAMSRTRADEVARRFGAVPIEVTAPSPGLPSGPRRWPEVVAAPAQPAYAILTSGSTGSPRAATVSQANLAGYAEHGLPVFGTTPADRVLQVASFGFDWSVSEIFLTLAAGATVVLRSAGALDSAGALAEEIDRYGITMVQLPTAVWHTLLPEFVSGQVTLPASLRHVTIGAEQAKLEAVRSWQQRFGAGPVRLVNSYGPTECTVEATQIDLSGPGGVDLSGREIVPIGHPLPGCDVYVLDDQRRRVPDGTAGTIFISGWGVGLGYLDDPATTEQRFVPDPFRPGPARMYDTRDVGRVNSRGELEFLGRTDNQVKIAGRRVELEEVERLLAAHPAVREVAVALRPATGTLAAFVVTAETIDERELRSWLAQRSPGYLVPGRVVPVHTLPRTVNDKVDVRTLLDRLEAERPAQDGTRDDAGSATARVEEVIAEEWRSVLGLSELSVDDDFFTLGGYSLLAVQVVMRLNKRGLRVQPRDIAAARSVRRLAGIVAERS